jgi:manganese-dependent inorganic pyrophosphatase
LQTMRHLAQERGYASFLFMIVDIINLRCHLLIAGGEHAVADVCAAPLESNGHMITVEDLVSRKKQVVPQLTRLQAALAGKV